MPLPLFWLGTAVASALVAKEIVDDRKRQQQSRYGRVKTLADLAEHESAVALYPSDVLTTEKAVIPVPGSIVCCGIAGVLDHTGIWIDDDVIIELDGNGLIKPVSCARFIAERSGQDIYVACDSLGRPLAKASAVNNAVNQIYQYQDYHLIENNCHQFVWQCFEQGAPALTTFKSLNRAMASFFDRVIYWDRVKR